MTVWIGLTGGIGSGKSQAAAEFASLGTPVLDTDQIGRELTAAQGKALPLLRQAFGGEIFSDGLLNRAALRQKVLDSEKEKKRLENILLPLILDEAVQRRQQYCGHIYGIIEIPLLAEQPDFQQIVGSILLIEANEKTRIARIMERSGLTETQVRQFVAAQAGDRQRRRLADEILLNNGSIRDLRQKIGRLHPYYQARFQHTTP
ncbi:Dephospho-CoA kinase [Kingella potus]|uniref:Dephospho-CoA kinase n=1 Tax=Kingella potus TaxID=265175 RepID=A0A377R1J0_9NEIS|nr:dephospho-CoA kinase [Kingella potus]UOP00970.1 dephospho-CoA kinase [Kingella potus]STR00628.1 Dephospho-CoA kinase [Kingella potus]